jgi:hypothetical protein
MKRETKVVASLFILGCVAGCASGGGGSGGSGPSTQPPPQTSASSPESPCGTINGRPVECVPNMRTIIDREMAEVEAELRKMPVDLFEAYYGYTPYWATGSGYSSSVGTSDAGTGYVRGDFSYETNAAGTVTSLQAHSPEYSARKGAPAAAVLDHQYQSFGVWNERLDASRGQITVWSQGQPTPAQGIPASGNATFQGRLSGAYVSPSGVGGAAASDLKVSADFGARSLGFASSGTTVNGTAAPTLDLRGTLTYAPGQGRFSGSVASASGTLRGSTNGQFYGPRAEELGGVFAAAGAGAERFVGAYGARR